MKFPQKNKNITTIWHNSTSKHLPEGNENTNSKRYIHLMFIMALFTIAKMWKQPKYSKDGSMDKEDVEYIHNGI